MNSTEQKTDNEAPSVSDSSMPPYVARAMRQSRNRARRERDQAMRDLGLVKCRVNGRTFWE